MCEDRSNAQLQEADHVFILLSCTESLTHILMLLLVLVDHGLLGTSFAGMDKTVSELCVSDHLKPEPLDSPTSFPQD